MQRITPILLLACLELGCAVRKPRAKDQIIYPAFQIAPQCLTQPLLLHNCKLPSDPHTCRLSTVVYKKECEVILVGPAK